MFFFSKYFPPFPSWNIFLLFLFCFSSHKSKCHEVQGLIPLFNLADLFSPRIWSSFQCILIEYIHMYPPGTCLRQGELARPWCRQGRCRCRWPRGPGSLCATHGLGLALLASGKRQLRWRWTWFWQNLQTLHWGWIGFDQSGGNPTGLQTSLCLSTFCTLPPLLPSWYRREDPYCLKSIQKGEEILG